MFRGWANGATFAAGTPLAATPGMRLTWIALAVVGVTGCASSGELSQRADAHMVAANRAATAGDYGRARAEQKKAEHLYQQADARAYEEGRPAPPPPETPAPLPVFDPQLER